MMRRTIRRIRPPSHGSVRTLRGKHLANQFREKMLQPNGPFPDIAAMSAPPVSHLASNEPHPIKVGTARLELGGVTSYRIEDRIEEGPRLGNVVMVNLFVGAMMAVLAGIFSEYLSPRFYLAVALFGLLAAAAIDDLIRSRGLSRQQLLVQRGDDESLVFVTPDPRAMRTAAAELDRRGVPRVA